MYPVFLASLILNLLSLAAILIGIGSKKPRSLIPMEVHDRRSKEGQLTKGMIQELSKRYEEAILVHDQTIHLDPHYSYCL